MNALTVMATLEMRRSTDTRPSVGSDSRAVSVQTQAFGLGIRPGVLRKSSLATAGGDCRPLAAFVRVLRVIPWTATVAVAAVIPGAADPCPAICEQADNSA
jgi:hypothetical protein